MSLDFLSDEELTALANKDYSKISDENIIKLKEYSAKQNPQDYESAIYERSLDMPKSVMEEKQKTGDSPLTFLDRMRVGFGNRKGVLDYLRGKGIDAVYRDDKLYVQNKDGSINPADPGLTSGFMAAVKDVPADIGEFVSDVPSMVLQELGMLGGGALGLATPIPGGAGAGATIGSAAGSGAGEKLRQVIGKGLNVYEKPEGEGFFDPETRAATAIGALAPLVPGAYRGGQKLESKIGKYTLEKQIPERIYANATGLSDQLVENPNVVKKLLAEKVVGTQGNILSKADRLRNEASNVLSEMLQSGDDITMDSVISRLHKRVSESAIGDKKTQQKVISELLGELESAFPNKNILGKQIARPDALNIEKRNLQQAGKKAFSDTPNVSLKKQGQASLSSALKESIEKASGDPEKVREINQFINAYSRLIESGEDKAAKELVRPLVSGTDALVAGAVGPTAVAKKAFIQKLLNSPYAGTKTASWLNTLMKNWAAKTGERTTKQQAAEIAAGSFLRDLMRDTSE